MRQHQEKTVFQDVDPADQPKASKLLFTVIGQTSAIYYVDGVDHGSLGENQGLCGYRIDEHGNRVDVVQLSPGTPWQLVDASYVLSETLGTMYARRVQEANWMGSYKAAYTKAEQEGVIAGQFGQFPVAPQQVARPPQESKETEEMRRFRRIMEEGLGGDEK